MKYSRQEVVRLLLERNCNVHLTKFNQSSVLHLAAKKGDADIIEMLLTAGHNVNAKNWGGNFPLLIACRFGQQAAVEQLLDAGAEVNSCNLLGHYALHYASLRGHTDLVRKLIDFGTDVDVQTHLGIDPLMLACEQNKCEVVQMLADRVSLNRWEKLYGGTVLHWVVASGCEKCTEHVIKSGASIYITDKSGRNALMQAVQSDKPLIVRLLLVLYTEADFSAGGASVTVLHLASYLGYLKCVEELSTHVKSKHLVGYTDCFGDTPLDLAVRQNNKDVVIYLQKLSISVKDSHTVAGNDVHGCEYGAHSGQKQGCCQNNENNCPHENDLKGHPSKSIEFMPSQRMAEANGPTGTELPRHMLCIDPTSCTPCTTNYTSNASVLQEQIPSDLISADNSWDGTLQKQVPRVTALQSSSSDKHPTRSSSTSTVLENHLVCSQFLNSKIEGARFSVCKTCSSPDTVLQKHLPPLRPLYKTYSPVKLAMLGMLKSAPPEQIIAGKTFDFSTWLDQQPQAFVLKVVNTDTADWVRAIMYNPWTLLELCRGVMRLLLGYRASDKVECLPLPQSMKDYLNMKELEGLNSKEIQIRKTMSYQYVDIE